MLRSLLLRRPLRGPTQCTPTPVRQFSNSSSDPTLARVIQMVNNNPSQVAAVEKCLSGESLHNLRLLVAQHEAVPAHVQTPTPRQLFLVLLQNATPFVGFGFVDNAVMIVAGDLIDIQLGVAFGISTIAAAGLGNTVSDVMGVGLGSAVETAAAKLGLPTAQLSPAQEALRVTRTVANFGSAVGVTVGCLLGMFPLLFLDTDRTQRLKQQNKIDDLFQSVLGYVDKVLDAEEATLYLVDKELGELWTKAAVSSVPVRTPLNQGLVGHCASTGSLLNISGNERVHYKQDNQVATRTAIDRTQDKWTLESHIRNTLCMPVLDRDGDVLGVLTVNNKIAADKFSFEDERTLAAMASHISVALENARGDERVGEFSLMEALKSCSDHHTHLRNYHTSGPVPRAEN